jgi:outer membrane protein, heavy metal efflux system
MRPDWSWNMKLFLRAGAAVVLVVCADQSAAQGLSFAEAVRRAASRDAPVQVANAAQIESARQSTVSAGALPDPKLLFGVDNLPVDGPDQFSLSRDFMTMQRIGLLQEFPSRAKRIARAAGAQSRIAVAEVQARTAQLAAMRETALAWLARDTAEKQLTRIESLFAENRLFDAAVRARLAAGSGLATEAVAARQEQASIDERRAALRTVRDQAIAALRQWIGTEVAESDLTGAAPEWPVDQDAFLRGLQHHPELALIDAQAQLLDAGIAEARAAKHPDWSMEVAYQKRGAPFSNMASLQFSIDLPVFAASRQNPEIAARRAERRALEAERETRQREHVQMFESQVTVYHRLASDMTRQRDVLLPLAEEKVALAMIDWRSGKAGVAEVVAARRERIDAELKLVALEGERRQVAASLHYTTGEYLGELP